MEIDTGLATHESGMALSVLEYGHSLLRLTGQSAGKDIIVDEISKERQLHGDDGRSEVPSEIGLPTMFRLEVTVATLIPKCTLVYAI